MIVIRKGISSHCNYCADDSPWIFWWWLWWGYKGNLKSLILVAPVLTWGSSELNKAPAYLQESGVGGIQEGLIWVWAITEMTVCYEAVADRAKSEHPLHQYPLHSLHYPNGDISGPSIAKMLLQCSRCNKTLSREGIYQPQSSFLRETHCRTVWKHVGCSCEAEKSASAGRDRALQRITAWQTSFKQWCTGSELICGQQSQHTQIICYTKEHLKCLRALIWWSHMGL